MLRIGRREVQNAPLHGDLAVAHAHEAAEIDDRGLRLTLIADQNIDEAADLLALGIRHHVAENGERLVQWNVLNLAGRRGGRCQQQCEQYSPAPWRHARHCRDNERRDQASARAPRFKFCCNARHGRRPDRCEHDTGGDEHDADRVVEVERLAKEQHREDAAEHRHQMPGLSRARRADQFDAAIEEQIGDERREHRDIGHGEPGRQAALDAAALRDLPQIERQDHQRADAHGGDQEAHRMRRGTHAEHRGVNAVDHHRDQDPDIASD